MKITKSQLKRIINEEIQKCMLNEVSPWGPSPTRDDFASGEWLRMPTLKSSDRDGVGPPYVLERSGNSEERFFTGWDDSTRPSATPTWSPDLTAAKEFRSLEAAGDDKDLIADIEGFHARVRARSFFDD